MIRTLRTLIATTSELITLRIQHHETDLPLEAEEDSLTNGRASSLGVSDGTWVMWWHNVHIHPLTYLIDKLLPEAWEKFAFYQQITVITHEPHGMHIFMQSYLPQAVHEPWSFACRHACKHGSAWLLHAWLIQCFGLLLDWLKELFSPCTVYKYHFQIESKLPKIMAWDME